MYIGKAVRSTIIQVKNNLYKIDLRINDYHETNEFFFPYVNNTETMKYPGIGFTTIPNITGKIFYTGSMNGCSIDIYRHKSGATSFVHNLNGNSDKSIDKCLQKSIGNLIYKFDASIYFDNDKYMNEALKLMKKSNVNAPAPYSILNPLISSLSPSAKSKGARFDSATIQIKAIGRKTIHKSHEKFWSPQPPRKITNLNKSKEKTIS